MSLNMGLLGSVAKKPNQFIATGLGSGYGSAVTSLDGPSYVQSYTTTYKLNKNGQVLWAVQFSGTGNKQGLAIDSNENVYVAGNGGFVAALNSSGNVLWQRTVSMQFSSVNWNSVATDKVLGGLIYLAGTDTVNGYLVCLNSSNGNIVWRKSTTGVNVEFTSISADYNQILATGYISNGTTLDSHVIKLDDSGNIGWQRRMSLGTSNFVFNGSTAAKGGGNSLVGGFINSPRQSYIVEIHTQTGTKNFDLKNNSTGGYISAAYGTVGYDPSGFYYLSFMNLYDNYLPYDKGSGYTRFLGSSPQKTVTFQNFTGALRLSTSTSDRTIGIMGTGGFLKVLGDDSVATGPAGGYTVIEDPEGFSYGSSGIGFSTDSVSYVDSSINSSASSYSPVSAGVSSTVTYLR